MLVVGLALLAVAVPVFIAIHIARSEGWDAERDLGKSYVLDALRRSEATANETYAGIRQLVALSGPHGDPCARALSNGCRHWTCVAVHPRARRRLWQLTGV